MGRNREPSTFEKSIGVQESTGWTIWFVACYIAAFICGAVVLSGGMSSTTKKWAFVKIYSDELIDSTVGKCSVSPEKLNLAELPLHWSWGLSGICAKYWDGYTACRHVFPASLDLLDMVTFSVEARLKHDNSDASLEKKMEPWVTAWAEMKGGLPSQSTVAKKTEIAAYLTLASTIISVILLAASILKLAIWKEKLRQWVLYLAAFCDTVLAMVAAAMVVEITNNGARATIRAAEVHPVEEKSSAEEGIFIVFASAVMRLVSISLFGIIICLPEILIAKWCCPSRRY